MHDFQEQCEIGSVRRCSVIIYFKTMYNKTIIKFGFCDIRNNQGPGKRYQPWPSAQLKILPSPLIILNITKTSSNHYLMSASERRPLA